MKKNLSTSVKINSRKKRFPQNILPIKFAFIIVFSFQHKCNNLESNNRLLAENKLLGRISDSNIHAFIKILED